jgi:hypothetical protein
VILWGSCAALREAQHAGGEWSECMCAITLCDVPVGGKQVQCILTQVFLIVPHVGCLPVTSFAKPNSFTQHSGAFALGQQLTEN